MLQATFQKYTLQFKQPSGTSRGVLRTKDSWFIFLQNTSNPTITGIGECGLLKGLSADDIPEYEAKVAEVCRTIHNYKYWLKEGLQTFPSIHFGLEIALKDLANQGSKILFPSDFTQKEMRVPINGLIWMGEKAFMFDQIKTKLAAGFDCIQQFSAKEIEIRVDANGAFSPTDALEKLKQLSEFDLHSIEQPIKQGQLQEMAQLCEKTPLPIALDEELIGIFTSEKKRTVIETIQPQHLIFKPSFIGGYSGTQEWMDLCEEFDTPWWMTSAFGLNAIAQWTATLDNPMPQGLGTGQLYTNNIESPLVVENGSIYYKQGEDWDLSNLSSFKYHSK